MFFSGEIFALMCRLEGKTTVFGQALRESRITTSPRTEEIEQKIQKEIACRVTEKNLQVWDSEQGPRDLQCNGLWIKIANRRVAKRN